MTGGYDYFFIRVYCAPRTKLDGTLSRPIRNIAQKVVTLCSCRIVEESIIWDALELDLITMNKISCSRYKVLH